MRHSSLARRVGIALSVLALGVGVARVMPAEVATFLGKVVVEWDDSDVFNRHKIKLLSDFAFKDASGKQWTARQGTELDGASFTPLFEQMVGLPFVGEHRRAGVLHDYYSKQLTEHWKDARRMYYAALLTEGLSENEAKTAYAVLYGAGLRWEVKGSTCYINCHSASTVLAWKPDVTESELESALEILGDGNPSLDQIDRAVDAVIPKPGPHLFSQLRREPKEPVSEDEAQTNSEVSEIPADSAIAPVGEREPEARGK